jgi:zinc protease
MLKGSKYADRLPIGTLENLQTFKPEVIRDYYKTWYRPDNQALIIVGDFDADSMEQKVKDFFSMTPCPSTPLNRPTYSIPDNTDPLIAIATDKEATSNTIMLFYKHPAVVEKTIGDFRQQELVSGLYENMLNNRLQVKRKHVHLLEHNLVIHHHLLQEQLVDILVKPMQKMVKYFKLLKQL